MVVETRSKAASHSQDGVPADMAEEWLPSWLPAWPWPWSAKAEDAEAMSPQAREDEGREKENAKPGLAPDPATKAAAKAKPRAEYGAEYARASGPEAAAARVEEQRAKDAMRRKEDEKDFRALLAKLRENEEKVREAAKARTRAQQAAQKQAHTAEQEEARQAANAKARAARAHQAPPRPAAGAKPSTRKPSTKPPHRGTKPPPGATKPPPGATKPPPAGGAKPPPRGGTRPPPKPRAAPARRPAAAGGVRVKRPPTAFPRVGAAMERVKAELRKGNTQMARQRLAEVRELRKEEELAAFITDDALGALEDLISTMPPAAEQVLKNATNSPFSALGIERQQQARILNTVNKRAMLKKYRKLALKLHPDKCEHEMALHGMQALNAAYEKLTKPAKAAGPKAGAKRPRPR